MPVACSRRPAVLRLSSPRLQSLRQPPPRSPLPLPSWARREHGCLGITLGLWSQRDPDLLGDRQACFLSGRQRPYLWSGLKRLSGAVGRLNGVRCEYSPGPDHLLRGYLLEATSTPLLPELGRDEKCPPGHPSQLELT